MGAGSWMEDAFKDMREDLWNERAYYERGRDREHAVEDAKLAYQRNLDAYGSRYQMTMADMKAAGLNPMLAVSQGVGGVPGASPAQQTGASFPRPSRSKTVTPEIQQANSAAAVAASTVELQGSQSRNVDADTRLKEQHANESRAREATEKEKPEHVRSEIRRIAADIDRLAGSTAREFASAGQAQAATAKLREEIQQVRAIIQNLTAHTDLYRAETSKVDVEKRIREIEEILKEFEKPESFNRASLHEGYLGRLSTLLKGLSPLIK